MVDVQSAVQIATELLGQVMPDYVALKPAVEEFSRSRNGDSWFVTFRARDPDAKERSFFPYRDKQVEIGIQNGELIAIRNPTYE